jgi:hypothetical protein
MFDLSQLSGQKLVSENNHDRERAFAVTDKHLQWNEQMGKRI